MGLDGRRDERTSDGRPDRSVRLTQPDANEAGERTELAEPRTRTEYYEARRTTEGASDEGTKRSGWDGISSDERPDLDALRITSERTTHILDGDKNGGGHRHGTGKPGKTEFPASWNDRKIIDSLLNVARRPDQTPGFQERNSRWLARGTRDDVEIVAVVTRDACVWSGWPLPGGPGVVKNPVETDGRG
jgi:hypothetical protein